MSRPVTASESENFGDSSKAGSSKGRKPERANSLGKDDYIKIRDQLQQIELAEYEGSQRLELKDVGVDTIEMKQIRAQTKIYRHIGLGVMFCLAWAGVIFCLGFDFTVGQGPLFAVVLLWGLSTIAAHISESLGCPGLLAQLLTGIILRNLPGDEDFLYLPKDWSVKIKAIGLCCIFLRSGLELDIPMIMRQGGIAARLTVCPGVTEAIIVGVASMFIFEMPFEVAVVLGFVLAAVSPAVVVSGMFDLQHRGYGIKKGIPSLIVAAASFDDVVALTGFSICIGSAIPSDHDAILGYMHAPIEIIGALVAGLIFGAICGCTIAWDTHWKRVAIILSSGFFVMMIAVHYHYSSMGALGCLCIGVVAAKCWMDALCGSLSLPENTHWHHEVEHDVAKIWKYVAQPLLFSVIGSSVDFSTIESSTIPKAIGVILIGATFRVCTAFGVTYGNNLTLKERLFIGLSWIPKATVQAALGALPLTMVESSLDKSDPDYNDYVAYGQNILVTAVFSILITAPIGIIVIDKFGPTWLEHTDPAEFDHEHGEPKWVRSEAIRRVQEEALTELYHSLAKDFFIQLTDEVECLKSPTLSEHDKAAILRKLTEGVLACHQVVNEQGANFPCRKLYELSPSYLPPTHKTLDIVSGEIIWHDETSSRIEKQQSEILVNRRRANSDIDGGPTSPAREQMGNSIDVVRRNSGINVMRKNSQTRTNTADDYEMHLAKADASSGVRKPSNYHEGIDIVRKTSFLSSTPVRKGKP